VRKHWRRPATEWLTLEEMARTKTRRVIVQPLSPQPKNRGRTSNCVPAPSSSVFVGKMTLSSMDPLIKEEAEHPLAFCYFFQLALHTLKPTQLLLLCCVS